MEDNLLLTGVFPRTGGVGAMRGEAGDLATSSTLGDFTSGDGGGLLGKREQRGSRTGTQKQETFRGIRHRESTKAYLLGGSNISGEGRGLGATDREREEKRERE